VILLIGHPVDPNLSFIYLSERVGSMVEFGRMALKRTCLLTVAAMSGAVLLADRRVLQETRGRASDDEPFNDAEE
jgi:hypothetical protein